MPLDSSATATTATNSATYLVNSRLRMFRVGGAGAAPIAGELASAWLSGVSGCSEMLISPNLARTAADVSCGGGQAGTFGPESHPTGFHLMRRGSPLCRGAIL